MAAPAYGHLLWAADAHASCFFVPAQWQHMLQLKPHAAFKTPHAVLTALYMACRLKQNMQHHVLPSQSWGNRSTQSQRSERAYRKLTVTNRPAALTLPQPDKIPRSGNKVACMQTTLAACQQSTAQQITDEQSRGPRRRQ